MRKEQVAVIVFASFYTVASFHEHQGHIEISPVNGPIGQIQVLMVTTSSSTGMSTG